MDYSEIEKQLPSKKKSVKELASLIGLRSEKDKSPNFSVFLGAGCSITSNIRSANELVTEWRDEFCKDHIGNVDEQKKYLQQNHPEWYDPNKEYSSLFEKKFDLQRHRRMFVEKEVDGKTPSIGYAYLTSLIEDNYFHTLFTTNFDDLINEAFYLYCEQRPIVCAQDSSINSVTVTSSRPKIIKLHGDFLFDDIKSTSRETESLEQNMKAKFTEFAKDFGLIVIGYSGCDRSIMDVISLLLKNDAYFKNGIYWCLKKGSFISEELRKLLWKEKVYFVEIDGFDEFFAELHSIFNLEGSIPISTSSFSRRPTEIINKLLKSESFLNSNSPILKNAYEQLSKESKRTTLMDLIIPKNKEEIYESEDAFSDDELIEKIEIQKLVSSNQFREAIDKARSIIKNTTKFAVRKDLYDIIIHSYRQLGDIKEAVNVVDEVINEQPFSAANHLLKADILTHYEEKLKSINRAIDINPHWFRSYYQKGVLLSKKLSDEFGVERENTFAEALKIIDCGLSKNPSLDNPCWRIKHNLISNHETNKSKKEKEISELIESLEIMNPQHPLVLQIKINKYESKDNSEIKSLISEIDAIKLKTLPKSHAVYEMIKLDAIEKIGDNLLLENEIATIKLSYDLPHNAELSVKIAQSYRDFLGDESLAIEVLSKAYQNEQDPELIGELIVAYIDSKNLKEAEVLLNKHMKLFTPSDQCKYIVGLAEAKGDYENCISEINKKELITGEDESALRFYYMLKQQKFEEVEKMGREYLEKINFHPSATAQIVNYEYACKKNRGKFSAQRLENVMQNNSNTQTKAAVYAILGNKTEMIANIKKSLKTDQTFRYDISKWPVFTEYQNDQEFSKLKLTNVS